MSAAAQAPSDANLRSNQPKRKPNGMLPTSPRNIFAGCQFQRKNPIAAAAMVKPYNPLIAPTWFAIPKIAMPRPMHIVSRPAKPSMPSMKLKRFINQTQISNDRSWSNQRGNSPWNTGSDGSALHTISPVILICIKSRARGG